MGAAFLNRNLPDHSESPRLPNKTKVFVGTPAWPNYVPLFKHAGFQMDTFNHYDRSQGSVNIKAALIAISAATRGSIFIFQVCCHNPTGQDYSQDHWKQLAAAVKARNHFVFFDIAYQGFASDMETDAWPVRCFAAEGIDLLACQSFSKHMGLSPTRSILVPQVLASICLLPSYHPSSFFFIHTTTSSRILLKLAAMNSTAQKTRMSTREVKKL